MKTNIAVSLLLGGLFLSACAERTTSGTVSEPISSQELFPQLTPAGALDRSGWKISFGPESPNDPAYLFDGSPSTLWTTRANQSSGMALQIDLGATRTYDKLVLDASPGSANFLRSLNVFVSNTPGAWGKGVRSVQGVAATRLELDLGQQSSRYITLQPGEAAPGKPWGVAEFWLVSSKAPPAPAAFAVKRSINVEIKRDARSEALPLPPTQTARFKTAGFDALRLMTDPSVYMSAGGDLILDAVPKRKAPTLDSAIQNALDAKLNVVVDLHSYEFFPGTQTQFNRYVLCGGGMAKYERFLEGLARHLAATYAKSRVALELMNEPNTNGCPNLEYPAQLRRMYDAARRGSSDLTLVLSPLGNSSAYELNNITPLPSAQNPDPNTIYTVHYYNSLAFTHQSASFTEKKFAFLSRIPYPPSNSSFAAVWPGVKARIDSAPINTDGNAPSLTVQNEAERSSARAGAEQELRCYFDGDCYYGKAQPYGRGNIEDAARQVSNWASRYNIAPSRLWLGEFGVLGDETQPWIEPASQNSNIGADPVDRARWTKDVREVFEAQGFGWAYFAYCCGGYGIVSDKRYLGADIEQWDQLTVDALNLKMP